ncbi:unnamed protein product [Porites evermanni]|uniref:Dermatopontin n=1 Tax=Porites evermanni TaxID=104178 RepID=A0ABN8Q8L5_9CNID|nr:unnamed protein product [Porites evermanni]
MDGSKMAKFLLLLIAVDLLLFSSTEAWRRRRRSRRRRRCSSSKPEGVAWVNQWQQPFSFSCKTRKSITVWQSEHRNCKGDRIHYFKCGYGPGRYNEGNCQWISHYVNGYYDPVMFKCEHNGFITGVQSLYNGVARDRSFRFRCCHKPRYIPYNCKHTTYVNRWDASLSFRVPPGCFLTGAYSYHRKNKHDRRWKFEICQFKKCRGYY